LRWSQLLVSVSSVEWVPPLGFVAPLRLVTGIVNGPERRGARRRSVRPAVQGRTGPSMTGRIPRQLTDHITLSDRDVPGENARRPALPVSVGDRKRSFEGLRAVVVLISGVLESVPCPW
jgi:hypothetical protein